MKLQIKLLERVYLGIIIIIFAVILLAPIIINDQSFLTRSLLIKEEFIESFVIFVFLISEYFVFNIYRQEHKKNIKKLKKINKEKTELEDRLNDAFNYIGSVNVQIQEIRDIFTKFDKYPQDKKDFKNILNFLAQKVLGIVNVDWVLFRIINIETSQIIREYSQTRGKAVLLKHNIEINDLLEGKHIVETVVIRSQAQNLKYKVFCIIPIDKISPEQEVMLKAIVSQLEMLFLIFTSVYYQK